MYVCISSLLMKLELHSEIGAIGVNQRFLVIESNFWVQLNRVKSKGNGILIDRVSYRGSTVVSII